MRSLFALGALGLVALSTACTVHGYAGAAPVEPVGTTYVTSGPIDNYDAYPHTVYEGRTVYYVNNEWGYPEEGRWVHYRHEPPELVRYRQNVREAPPAHPVEPRYEGPRHEERRDYEAPPAERVR